MRTKGRKQVVQHESTIVTVSGKSISSTQYIKQMIISSETSKAYTCISIIYTHNAVSYAVHEAHSVVSLCPKMVH